MIPFADLPPNEPTVVGSALFTIALLVPAFAVLLYLFQRILLGPRVRVEDDPDIAAALGPIHQAAIDGDWERLAPLVEAHRDDPVGEGVVEAGATALHLAAGSGHGEVASLLLARGADPNRPDGQGRTPLHYAAEAGSAEAVGTLLAGGAKAELPDARGALAEHLAHEGGFTEAAALLKARGA